MVATSLEVRRSTRSSSGRVVSLRNGISVESNDSGAYNYVRYPNGAIFCDYARPGATICNLADGSRLERGIYPHARDRDGDWMMVSNRRRYSKWDALFGCKQRYLDDAKLDEMSMLEALEGLVHQGRDEELFLDEQDEPCRWKGRDYNQIIREHGGAADEPEPVLLPTTMVSLKSLSVKRLPGGYVWMGAGRRAKGDSATKWFRRNEQGVLTTYLHAAGEPVAIPNASEHFARCLRQAEMVEQHATTFEANSRELLMLLEEMLPDGVFARDYGDQFTWDQLARDLNELCLYPSCLGDKVRLLDALHLAAQHRPLTNLTVQAVLQSIGASVAEINRLANAGNHRKSTALAASGIKRAANLLLAKPNQQ